jgi:hypothetical protein
MNNQEFTYTIKGITLDETEVKEIYKQYQWFKEAKLINNTLKLDDMELAKNVAEYYHDMGWSIQENITEAVQDYIHETLSDYLISNNIMTFREIYDTENNDRDYFVEDILSDKCNMNVKSGENLCDELKPLHELYVKYNKWLKNQ